MSFLSSLFSIDQPKVFSQPVEIKDFVHSIHKTASKIIALFKERDWRSHIARQIDFGPFGVKAIKGDNFKIDFTNVLLVNEVAINHQSLKLNSDSTLELRVYCGTSWEQDRDYFLDNKNRANIHTPPKASPYGYSISINPVESLTYLSSQLSDQIFRVTTNDYLFPPFLVLNEGKEFLKQNHPSYYSSIEIVKYFFYSMNEIYKKIESSK